MSKDCMLTIPNAERHANTLLIEAPAISTAELSRTFPAGYLLSIYDWLLQVKDFPRQTFQYCTTVTIASFFIILTFDLWLLHVKQNIENYVNNAL